jgi:TRAP transporter 4TM/12TM fusion protein
MAGKEIDHEIQKAEEAGKELLEKFEGKQRELKGGWGKAVTALAIGASAYHLFYAYVHPFFALDHRVIHWAFMSSLLFLLYPASKKLSPSRRPSVLDILLLLASLGFCLWVFSESHEIMQRAGSYRPFDVIAGSIFILLVLEAARRSVGWSVPLIAVIFLLYALLGPYLPEILAHKGYSIKRISTYIALSTDGIFSIPLGVSAQFIFLFILYGAILRKSGAGKFFTDLAFSLTGWSRGGPAKAAVISSCFFGMISGSSVANTVTTGTFTIPLMKRTGYPPHFAGAVEASASTMGQIMPPIMGAGAFIMAEFLGIPYFKVCLMAAIPATLAFFAIFMQVHYRAVQLGIQGIPKSDLPSLKKTFLEGWHHLLSMVLLIYLLALDYSPERAVFWAVWAAAGVSYLKKQNRISIAGLIEAFREGALGTVEVAAACATAGIIIGSITVTGLGLKFSSLIMDLSMGYLLLALPFTAIACLALGMGVPTTASYIIISSLAVPALIHYGVIAAAAHMFIFYYATRADVTPPVALAAYAGAGIAGANPSKTGYTAFWLGMAGYIIPFMFIYGPELMLIGRTADIIWATITAVIGIIFLAAAVQRCMYLKTRWYESILFFAAALLLIKPGLATDLVGFLFGGLAVMSQRMRRKEGWAAVPGQVT